MKNSIRFALATIPLFCGVSARAQEQPGQITGYNLFLGAGYESLRHEGGSVALGTGGDISGTLEGSDGMRLGLVAQGRLNIARDLYLVAGPTLKYAELSGSNKGTVAGKNYSVRDKMGATLLGLEAGLEGYANKFIRLQGVVGIEGVMTGQHRRTGTLGDASVSTQSDLDSFRRVSLAGRALWELSPNTSVGIEPAWVRGSLDTKEASGARTDFSGFALGAFFGLHF